jgi:hypothetical protein
MQAIAWKLTKEPLSIAMEAQTTPSETISAVGDKELWRRGLTKGLIQKVNVGIALESKM